MIKPGIYHLNADPRIADRLIAAGGFSANADGGWGEKRLNLAAKLADGAKVYIPRVGETNSPAVGTSFQNASSDTSMVSDAKVNINSASVEQLDGLPGIGMVTAQKIITARPFGDIQELVSKKIVRKRVFKRENNSRIRFLY